MKSQEKVSVTGDLCRTNSLCRIKAGEKSLEEDSPASVFDSSFVDKCYKVADGDGREPRTGPSCDL